jgi:hypothetical protein
MSIDTRGPIVMISSLVDGQVELEFDRTETTFDIIVQFFEDWSRNKPSLVYYNGCLRECRMKGILFKKDSFLLRLTLLDTDETKEGKIG